MPTTLTSMTPTAIVSSIVESTSRQLEGTFGKLEGTSIDVEVAWAGSYLLIRAHVTIGTSPRDNCYEHSFQ